MGEIRKDYILDRYVIIARERAKRPHQFDAERPKERVAVDFFAPGYEGYTPPEIGRREDHNGWYIRWFENKFPVVQVSGNPNLQTHNEFYTFSDVVGRHEVIVESPKIEDELADLSVRHIKEVFEVFRERINELSKNPDIRYVCVFKNHLKDAGTSVVHTHSQVIAYNLVPPVVREKVDAFKKYGKDAFLRVIQREKDSDRRVFENESFIAVCPYASRFPMETIIIPKRYARTLDDFDEDMMMDLAESVRVVLGRLQEINAPYNMIINYAPPGEEMHFHIEICPRLSIWAGFEIGTGMVINPVTPEDAAKFFREGK